MTAVKVDNLTKFFPVNSVLALDNMTLEVTRGEIHAVVGENGAGKSTLMKILHGIETKDSGDITIHGNTGMVSQHFRLIDDFSILDNIIIGSEPRSFLFFLNRKKAKKRVHSILKQFNFKLDLNQKVAELTIGQRQLVEIIKVIYNNADILIFDEPTATLSDPEAEKLRSTLLSLKNNGKTIILISHKIMDIESISDRFTIMRKGRFVKTVNTKEVNIKDISKYMSGDYIFKKEQYITGNGKIIFKSDKYNIILRKGEVLAFTGYGGCGLHDIESYLEKLSIGNSSIGFIPSDRLSKGVDLNSKLSENLVANDIGNFTTFGILNKKKIQEYSKEIIDKYNIAGEPQDHTGILSGGNIQKAIVGRTLQKKPEILVLSAPTWGIDMESTSYIYSLIEEFKNNGHGIIVLSFDLEEVLQISDRINVMYKGSIIKELQNSEKLTTKVLGHLCAGIK